mmetsp:Transcript_46799/g.72965  ORF Transcript_46799/g.72965 Transcript_46799/m.72965 type:complete len:231 (+) Transcript_46799:771-1463(+)
MLVAEPIQRRSIRPAVGEVPLTQEKEYRHQSHRGGRPVLVLASSPPSGLARHDLCLGRLHRYRRVSYCLDVVYPCRGRRLRPAACPCSGRRHHLDVYPCSGRRHLDAYPCSDHCHHGRHGVYPCNGRRRLDVYLYSDRHPDLGHHGACDRHRRPDVCLYSGRHPYPVYRGHPCPVYPCRRLALTWEYRHRTSCHHKNGLLAFLNRSFWNRSFASRNFHHLRSFRWNSTSR